MAIEICIALDDIRSHHNVGSCFRSADAFSISEVLLGGISPQPPHRDIHKTALGATESVSWTYHETLLSRLKEMSTEGYKIVAIEQTKDSTPISEVDFAKADRLVLVFGNEVKGVSQGILEMVDETWEIPQSGIKKSLNISVCAGICMQHVRYRTGN